jgi:hypothetical protein
MRTLMSLFVTSAIIVVLIVGVVVARAVGLLPYIIVGMVIGVLLRRRRLPHPRPVYRQPLQPPQHPLPPPGRWVYVPVWVGPPPRRPKPVIDAQFVRDPRDG